VFKVASSTVASSEVPAAPSLAVPVAAPTLALQGDGKKVEEEKLPEGENVEPNKPVLQMEKKECDELFDPCTKEPIASLEALEKRIRDIKKQRDIVPVGLYGLTNDTSNYDFLTKVFIDPKVSLDDMVSFKLSANRLPGTDIYEVLSRLFVFFGGITDVNPRDGGNYKFMDRAEDGKIYNTSEDALRNMKCIASSGSGVSDITLVYVNSTKKLIQTSPSYCEVDCEQPEKENIITKTYLMSVKWRKKEKNAENVDLEKLRIAQQEKLSPEQRPADSIVFIKSKKDFQISNNRMFRQYVQYLAKTFFGWNEDVKPFLEEKRRNIFEIASLTEKTPLEVLRKQYFNPKAKPILSLQLHQDIIVKGLCDTLTQSEDKLYLIGVLPRGGKTYIAGGVIREYLRRNPVEKFNILWLTAAPSETLEQVECDLIDKFGDFNDFEFVDIRQGGKKTPKPHTVFFCSSQLLIQSEKPNPKQRVFLENLKRGIDNIGIIFFDEAHKTGTGDMTKENLQKLIQQYSFTYLPIIFLTATYYSIRIDYQIKDENTFI